MDHQTTVETKGKRTRVPALSQDSALLRMSEAALQMTAAVAGVSVGALASLAIYSSAPEGSTIARLFDLGRAQGVLPAAMLGMFFWGVILLGLRLLRVGKAESISSPESVGQLMNCVSSMTLDDLLAQIENARTRRSSLLLRRIRVVLRQWAAKPSLQDTMSLLNQQAVEDTEDIHHAYGVVKTFVWALPVLGLIGTVVGIALAVGDFGQLIGGNVDDVVVIKQSLVQVTSGLSFAFTTTLLGLLGALLLALPSSALQAREEKLVTRTEGMLADTVLPQLQRLYPEVGTTGIGPDAEVWRDTLTEVAQSAIQAAGTTANRTILEAQEALGEWHRQRSVELERAATGIADATGRIGEDMRTASEDFLARLSLIRETMDQQASAWREGLDRGFAASEENASRLDAAMERHDTLTGDLAAKMLAIQEAATTLLSTQTALSVAMRELTDGGTARTLESLTESLSALNGQAHAIDQTLSAVAGATGKLTECQAALQEGLRQIDTIGLPSALNGLRQTLTEVSEVLLRFQEPIVFQAVRASSVVRTEPGSPKHGVPEGNRHQKIGDES